MDKGFIMNDEGVEIISEEEIIKKVFEACPQLPLLPNLLRLDGWFRNTNTSIVDILNCNRVFSEIIDKHFIEVCEDGSFDYEYGDICSTHHELICVGYARKEDVKEEDIKYIWDIEWY